MRTTKVNRVADNSAVSYMSTDDLNTLSNEVVEEIILIGKNLNLTDEVIGNYLVDKVRYSQVIIEGSIKEQLEAYKINMDNIQDSEDF